MKDKDRLANKEDEECKKKRLMRLEEATAFLPIPLTFKNSPIFMDDHYLDMQGGVFNPGVVSVNKDVLALARGEKFRCLEVRGNMQKFLQSSCPVFLKFNSSFDGIKESMVCVFRNKEEKLSGKTAEDFRLFKFNGRVLCSHTVVSICGNPGADVMSAISISVGLSEFMVAVQQLHFMGCPKGDFEQQHWEKNWAFFEHQGELYVIYSFQPYRLFVVNDLNSLFMKKFIDRQLSLPQQFGEVPFRNSTHPVDYDEWHYISIIHKKLNNVQFVFWAVLIDKKTLLPAWISCRPVIRSNPIESIIRRGNVEYSTRGIVYVSSLIAEHDHIRIFYGIDDNFFNSSKIMRKELDLTWLPIH